MSGIKPVAWLVGNQWSGPYALRKTDPKGWGYAEPLMKIADHEAEIAALRKDAERYHYVRAHGEVHIPLPWVSPNTLCRDTPKGVWDAAIDEAMKGRP